MQWALISVTDKTGIEALARSLLQQGIGILASGGSAQHLENAGIAVTRVETLTGFEQLLGGRVKTLHPVLYAGILSQESVQDQKDRAMVAAPEISVVVVNLYDFEGALAASRDLEDLVEAIDVGGVSLIRAAAKNFERVLVVTRPEQYDALIARQVADFTLEERRVWASQAFRHMAYYDAVIGNRLAEDDHFGPFMVLAGRRQSTALRYGENPHQAAAWYRTPGGGGLGDARLVQGKPLSYNNVLDADAAWRLARELPEAAVVAVKHQIPCGVAVGQTPQESYRWVHASDPVSIFGGIVAVHGSVDEDLAADLVEVFLEVVVAKGYTPSALAILAKKKNLRVLEMLTPAPRDLEVRMVAGGFLAQESDRLKTRSEDFRHVAGPLVQQWTDVDLAWRTAAHVRSNAIVIARDGATVGIGGGETNRIDAARHALERAGDRARGAVLASDGFFPFGDVVWAAAEYGIRVVVEPGGALRDQESVSAADKAGITLIFTGERHFRH